MEKVRLSNLVSYLFLLVLCVSCAANKSDQRNNSVLEAYRLIDENRTDEGIQLLEDSLKADPLNSELKMVLASAYAHKAGIKIQKLVPAIIHADKIKKISEAKKPYSEQADTNAKINLAAFNIAKTLSQFAVFFEAYATIPLINKEQSVYIKHAIQLINEMTGDMKSEDLINKNCQIDVSQINQTLISLGKLTIDIFNDLAIANPKQASQMKNSAAQAVDAVMALNIATTSISIIDEISQLFIKDIAVQNNFGRIFRCSE